MNLKEAYSLYQKNNLQINRQQYAVLSAFEDFNCAQFDSRVHAATLSSFEYLWAVACTIKD